MQRLLMAVVLVFLAGPAFAQDVLTGTWKSDLGGATMTFESSNSYTIVSLGEFDYSGNYTISGQTITFEDAFGSQVCPGVRGIYNFNLIVNSIEFAPIDDLCADRRDRLRGTWTNSEMF